MSRQDANAAFALTSFLYGGNAAYVEDLHARYLADPASVDAQWQAFFQNLKDDGADAARIAAKNAYGPSWRRGDWPQPARSDLTAALDGDWREVEIVVGDKVTATARARGAGLSAAEVRDGARVLLPPLALPRALRAGALAYANPAPMGLPETKSEETLTPRPKG